MRKKFKCIICGEVFEVQEGEEPVCPLCGATGDDLEPVDSYTLYFFDKLVGGVPTAEAYRTVSGTGKVRYIRRATPVAVSNLIMTSPTAMRAMPIFPTSE